MNTLEQATMIRGNRFLLTSAIPSEYVGEVVLSATQNGWCDEVKALKSSGSTSYSYLVFLEELESVCYDAFEDCAVSQRALYERFERQVIDVVDTDNAHPDSYFLLFTNEEMAW